MKVIVPHIFALMSSAILAACSDGGGDANEREGTDSALPSAVLEAACAPPAQLGPDWQVRLAGLQLATPPRKCPRGDREGFVVDVFTARSPDDVAIGSLPKPDEFIVNGEIIQGKSPADSNLTHYVLVRMSPVVPRALSHDRPAPIGGCANGRCKMAFWSGGFIVQVAWHAALYGSDLKQVAYNLDCIFEKKDWCNG